MTIHSLLKFKLIVNYFIALVSICFFNKQLVLIPNLLDLSIPRKQNWRQEAVKFNWIVVCSGHMIQTNKNHLYKSTLVIHVVLIKKLTYDYLVFNTHIDTWAMTKFTLDRDFLGWIISMKLILLVKLYWTRISVGTTKCISIRHYRISWQNLWTIQ